MSTHPDILAIDDDHAFIRNLKIYFEREGVEVATITDATLAPALEFHKFKVVLLDLDMPGLSGEEILAQMPGNNRPVVIIVSGHSDLGTRIRLLDSGADFFLPKPVDLAEMLLICRRALGRQTSDLEIRSPWVLSRSRHALISPESTSFGLTASEFRILERLIEASPNVVTKETLASAVTAREGDAAVEFYRSLEVMISRMRGRFSGPDTLLPIKALRNVGYVFHGTGQVEN